MRRILLPAHTLGSYGRKGGEGHTGDNLNLGNAVRVAQHHTNLRGRCTLARQLGDLLFHLVRRGLEPVGGSLDSCWRRQPRRCRWCPVVPVEVGSGRTRWAQCASKGGPKPKYPFRWSEDDPLLCCCCCWSGWWCLRVDGGGCRRQYFLCVASEKAVTPQSRIDDPSSLLRHNHSHHTQPNGMQVSQ